MIDPLLYLLPLFFLAFGIHVIFSVEPILPPQIEHEDILAELDREFPAALALPVRRVDVPCADCATSGLAGFCPHRAPKAPSVPVAMRSRLPPGVVQINWLTDVYTLIDGQKVSRVTYTYACMADTVGEAIRRLEAGELQ